MPDFSTFGPGQLLVLIIFGSIALGFLILTIGFALSGIITAFKTKGCKHGTNADSGGDTF